MAEAIGAVAYAGCSAVTGVRQDKEILEQSDDICHVYRKVWMPCLRLLPVLPSSRSAVVAVAMTVAVTMTVTAS